MRLIINASTLSATGVTQVAVSFLEECKKFSNNLYLVIISKQVASQIKKTNFPSNFNFIEIENNPRLIIGGYRSRKLLSQLEKSFQPDCFFTIFGPSYYTPRAPHLQGYAYPHYVYPDSPFFNHASFKTLLKTKLYAFLHRHFFLNNGKYYVTETEDVSKRLSKYLGVTSDRIYTVNNTFNHHYANFLPKTDLLPIKDLHEFRLLSLCSFADHKNLSILNKVIPILNRLSPEHNIKFILTVDQQVLLNSLSAEAMSSIINLGRLDVSDCPQIYSECDALFLPTLLECFSANYPEAMYMKRPILTSNLSFATSICDKAAIYFDPMNPVDIAEKILKLIYDKQMYDKLVIEGLKRIKTFNSSNERAKAYIEICQSISNKKYN